MLPLINTDAMVSKMMRDSPINPCHITKNIIFLMTGFDQDQMNMVTARGYVNQCFVLVTCCFFHPDPASPHPLPHPSRHLPHDHAALRPDLLGRVPGVRRRRRVQPEGLRDPLPETLRPGQCPLPGRHLLGPQRLARHPEGRPVAGGEAAEGCAQQVSVYHVIWFLACFSVCRLFGTRNAPF